LYLDCGLVRIVISLNNKKIIKVKIMKKIQIKEGIYIEIGIRYEFYFETDKIRVCGINNSHIKINSGAYYYSKSYMGRVSEINDDYIKLKDGLELDHTKKFMGFPDATQFKEGLFCISDITNVIKLLD